MEIRNFKSIRVGSGFPACFDVKVIDGHESYGVYAEAYTYKKPNEPGYFQLRKHNYDNLIALFAFKYNDMNLPKDWEDSIVLWDSRNS